MFRLTQLQELGHKMSVTNPRLYTISWQYSWSIWRFLSKISFLSQHYSTWCGGYMIDNPIKKLG